MSLKKKKEEKRRIHVRIPSRSNTRDAINSAIMMTTTRYPRWKSKSVGILPVIALEAYVCGYKPLERMAIA